MSEILLPVARLISGSLYRPRDKDSNGAPLVIKQGPRASQPRVDFALGLAIPKVPGHTHWSQTEWGAVIYQQGAAFFPQMYQSRDFSWKIDDGDSTDVNKAGKRLCDREGAPGHWVLWLGGGFAPHLFVSPTPGTYERIPSGSDVPEALRRVKTGDYVQANISIASNTSTQSPGIYLNHGMVLFVGAGAEIKPAGPDALAVFGANAVALPAGASPVPAGVASLPVGVPPVVAVAPQPVAVAPQPVAVAPHPAILAPVAPVPPAVPPATPVRQMTAKAGGATYEAFKSAGWTDAALVDQGYMAA